MIDFITLKGISKLALPCKDKGHVCVSIDREEVVGGYTGS